MITAGGSSCPSVFGSLQLVAWMESPGIGCLVGWNWMELVAWLAGIAWNWLIGWMELVGIGCLVGWNWLVAWNWSFGWTLGWVERDFH